MYFSLRRLFIVLISATVLFPAGAATAQDENTCSNLVDTALSQLSNVCANPQANTLCLGNEPVTASLVDQATPSAFSQRGDHLSLTNVATVQTGPISLTNRSWGVGLMNIQADLPLALAERGVVLLVSGGTELENRVPPEQALTLTPGISLTLTQAVELHTSPLLTADILLTIPTHSAVSADAISPDQQWVRVVYENAPGWVSRTAFGAELVSAKLTPVGPDSFTPMQSFYVRNPNLNTPASGPCAQSPAFLLAQGPKATTVDIRAQDVPIRIESTILMSLLPSAEDQCGQLQLTSLFGLATLYPDTETPLAVPPGYTIKANIPCDENGDPDSTHPLVFADWPPPAPMSPAELEQFGLINTLPTNLLNYPIQLPFIVQASGKTVISLVTFIDPEATGAAQKACDKGFLSAEICQSLGF